MKSTKNCGEKIFNGVIYLPRETLYGVNSTVFGAFVPLNAAYMAQTSVAKAGQEIDGTWFR